MKLNKFAEVLTWKEHIRYVMEEWDYNGKDGYGDPLYEHTDPYPLIQYQGTYKIGGTNTSIGFKDGNVWYQSRNNILDEDHPISDMAGFKAYCQENDIAALVWDRIQNLYFPDDEDEVIVYGEWCGKDIKDAHSISQLDKKVWIIFAVKINGKYEVNTKDLSCPPYFYNVKEWGMIQIFIDFDNYKWGCWEKNCEAPEHIQNMIDKMTLECQVAESFGIQGLGEGLVLTTMTKSVRSGEPMFLKLKNSRYEKTKVAPKIETIQNPAVKEFVTEVCSTARLMQFINQMGTEGISIEMRNVKTYQDYVVNDIIKECSKTEADLGLNKRDWEAAVRRTATVYYSNFLKR